jgi:hypothetical protein
MNQTFCCAAMDILVNDTEFPIEYKPEIKRYGIVSKSKIYRKKNEITQSYDIDFCPKCGSELPKRLVDKWLPSIEKQFNITETLQENLKKLPKNYAVKKTNNSNLSIEKIIANIPKTLETVSNKVGVELVNTKDKDELKKQVANIAQHIRELEDVMFLAKHIQNQDDCTKVLFFLYRYLLHIIEDLDVIQEIVVKANQNYYVAFLKEDE